MATLACVSLGRGNALGFHSGRRTTSQKSTHSASHAPSMTFTGKPNSSRASMSRTLCRRGCVVGLRFANTTACSSTFAAYSPQHTSPSRPPPDAASSLFDMAAGIGALCVMSPDEKPAVQAGARTSGRTIDRRSTSCSQCQTSFVFCKLHGPERQKWSIWHVTGTMHLGFRPAASSPSSLPKKEENILENSFFQNQSNG
jgi:hypothetical protein